MNKLKIKQFFDNSGFVCYKLNISFVAEQLPYSLISGTKVGASYKKRRLYHLNNPLDGAVGIRQIRERDLRHNLHIETLRRTKDVRNIRILDRLLQCILPGPFPTKLELKIIRLKRVYFFLHQFFYNKFFTPNFCTPNFCTPNFFTQIFYFFTPIFYFFTTIFYFFYTKFFSNFKIWCKKLV